MDVNNSVRNIAISLEMLKEWQKKHNKMSFSDEETMIEDIIELLTKALDNLTKKQ